MKQPTTIPRSGPQDLCTNYQALLREGVRHCQELAGDFWTDFNQHDPGVTILQQLCYAITDLSYRTDSPMVDLLAGGPDAPAAEQPLYTGDKVLTCNPVTAVDYRKLLSDCVPGVKNTWLVAMKNHPLGIQGLYEVLVETREEIRTELQAAMVARQVEQYMRSARNLCEDVGRVTLLKPQPIRVEGTIEIAPQANPVTVLAKVLFDIQNSLIPYPKVQSPDELFSRLPPDQIWNGPRLGHGSLDQESLKPLKASVDVQEIVRIILQTRGVKRVKDLKASSPEAPGDSPIQIKNGYVPRLDPPILQPQESYGISIELEGGVKWHVDTKAVWTRIRELEAAMRNRMAYAARSIQTASYCQPLQGENRNVGKYFSIQHQFPVVYGLSKYGVADNMVEGLVALPKAEHQARIQQLKGYLLFFEQLLANYLSQLANVGNLFSLDEELRRSYFYQPVVHQPSLSSDPLNIEDVLLRQTGGALRSFSHYLVCVVNPGGKIVFVSQRLSKLSQAEQVRGKIIESGQHNHNYRVRKSTGNEYQLALHGHGGEFLALGQERFSTPEAASSAIERWASFMTGLIRVKQLLERLVKIYRREDLSLQVVDADSRIVLSSAGIQSQEERERRIADILSFGSDPGNYRFAAVARGGFRLHLHSTRGEMIAEGEETFDTEFDAEEGVDRLVSLIAQLAQNPALHPNHIRRLPEVEEIKISPVQTYVENLQALERNNDTKYLDRRNNFLNHLLARFGEHFDDDILEQLDLRPFGEKDDFYYERIRWKIEFLRRYIEAPCNQKDGETDDRRELGLGSGRGQAFDYGAGDGCNAVSGMERRLSLLLGIDGHIDGSQYRRMDPDNEGQADEAFYYVEKPVATLGSEQVQDEQGEKYAVPRHRILGSWRAGEPDLHDLHHNFVFSSEDSGILRHLLSFGTNRDNYRLHVVRDEYRVIFRLPNSAHGMEIHRAIGRQEAEEAISFLIHHLQRIKESVVKSYSGERIRIVEHVLLRPRGDAQQSPVRISHGTGLNLTSRPVAEAHRGKHLESILRHGQHQENYRIETDSFGDVILVLYQGQTPIAYTHGLRDEREAAAAIALLAELIRSLAGDEKAHEKHVHKEAHDTFYSQRLSVILPSWPLRFQSNEFKLYAEQLVQENAPAHVAVNCFWLSSHDMGIFEKLYSEWKGLLVAVHGEETPEAYQVSGLNDASEKLRVFIQKLQKEQNRGSGSTAGKS